MNHEIVFKCVNVHCFFKESFLKLIFFATNNSSVWPIEPERLKTWYVRAKEWSSWYRYCFCSSLSLVLLLLLLLSCSTFSCFCSSVFLLFLLLFSCSSHVLSLLLFFFLLLFSCFCFSVFLLLLLFFSCSSFSCYSLALALLLFFSCSCSVSCSFSCLPKYTLKGKSLKIVGVISLFVVIKTPVDTENVMPMEQLPINNNGGQGYGFILYEKELDTVPREITIHNISDRAQVLQKSLEFLYSNHFHVV